MRQTDFAEAGWLLLLAARVGCLNDTDRDMRACRPIGGLFTLEAAHCPLEIALEIVAHSAIECLLLLLVSEVRPFRRGAHRRRAVPGCIWRGRDAEHPAHDLHICSTCHRPCSTEQQNGEQRQSRASLVLLCSARHFGCGFLRGYLATTLLGSLVSHGLICQHELFGGARRRR